MSTCGVKLQSEHELQKRRSCVCSIQLTESSYAIGSISVISKRGKKGMSQPVLFQLL